jgi:hypothetical protein
VSALRGSRRRDLGGENVTSARVPVRTLVLVLTLVLSLAAASGLVTVRGLSLPGAALAEPDERAEGAPHAVRTPSLRPPSEIDLGSFERPPQVAPLTGVALDPEDAEELERRPAAIVKIPNNELAHPHTGLEHADVVYEQETEGGTTRFAAVFHSTHPDVVGNIRSARPVDISLAAPYEGVFVYAGARAEVLEMIEAARLTTVGAGGPGYFTQDHRNAPHHLYSRLPEAVAERDAPAPPATPWRFAEEPPTGGLRLTEPLRVLMSPIAATSWDYDEDAGVFRRLQNDRPHEVTGPQRIGASNVVVLDVTVTGRDSAGAPVYRMEDAGEALLLRDGRLYEIGWEKPDVRAHLRLVDGIHDARLRPGSTWVLLTYDGRLDELRERAR